MERPFIFGLQIPQATKSAEDGDSEPVQQPGVKDHLGEHASSAASESELPALESESDDAPGSDEAPPEEAPVEPLNVVAASEVQPLGLQEYRVAPTGKASCPICGRKVEKGSYTLAYRFRVAYSRWVHGHCAGRLPENTRDSDRRLVAAWASVADQHSPEAAFLNDVAERLR